MPVNIKQNQIKAECIFVKKFNLSLKLSRKAWKLFAIYPYRLWNFMDYDTETMNHFIYIYDLKNPLKPQASMSKKTFKKHFIPI